MAKLLSIGHRGACGHEPENTLRSFRRALELGADGVEADVRLANGELVVIHDATFNRTTNGRGRVSRKTFEALRQLDAGGGEQIPTLREVIETVNRRAFLNVELKGRGTAEPTLRLLREFLDRSWRSDDFLISSFNRRTLRKFAELANGEFPIGLLFTGMPRGIQKLAREFQAVSIHPTPRWTTPRLVKKAHQLGLRVFPYTVNLSKNLARMRALGVDGVFTDFPDRVETENRAES